MEVIDLCVCSGPYRNLDDHAPYYPDPSSPYHSHNHVAYHRDPYPHVVVSAKGTTGQKLGRHVSAQRLFLDHFRGGRVTPNNPTTSVKPGVLPHPPLHYLHPLC